MLHIGCHLSASKGFAAMGREALKINADTFQFFTRNPRGGAAKEIDEADVKALLQIVQANAFAPLLAHAPYTLNVCSAKEETRTFARSIFKDDLERMEYLPGSYYNFHPGSHVGQGVDVGCDFIVEMLNAFITPQQSTTVLLETMAGKGSEIGRSFEELQNILEKVEQQEKVGICLDTCHVLDGGYDIVNRLEEVLEKFDKVIGLKKLRAVHLNDSMYGLESHKDRHAKIGEGAIGLEAISRIICHPVLKTLPFYLETPNDVQGYGEEIQLLRGIFQRESEGK
ncbi:MAG: deoxyribonuclease IV [Oscillospiraceae bacterium]|nr:deoxyribonuclease IV [Oscillospiraceae bacterium]